MAFLDFPAPPGRRLEHSQRLQPRFGGNRASADFIISSPLRDEAYDRLVPDYRGYRERSLP